MTEITKEMLEHFVPLPQPFSINQGTATKLIARLGSGDFEEDSAQLGYEFQGQSFRNVEGVLCEVVNAPRSVAWDACSVLFHGAQFFAPQTVIAAAKIRGQFPDFLAYSRAITVLRAVLESRVKDGV